MDLVSFQTNEYQNQKILTTEQVAESYGVVPQIIINNFNRNKKRYTLGIDYFILEGKDLQDFISTHQINFDTQVSTNQIDLQYEHVSKLYLWTEYGILLHAKSLNTDNAWEVYRFLREHYFRSNEQIAKTKDYIAILIGALNNAGEQNAKLIIDLQHLALSPTSLMDVEMILFRLRQYMKLDNKDASSLSRLFKQLEIDVAKTQEMQEIATVEHMKLAEYHIIINNTLKELFQPNTLPLLESPR